MISNSIYFNQKNRVRHLSMLFIDLILLYMFIFYLFVFFELWPSISHFHITLLSVISLTLLLFSFFITENKNGISASLLAYLILTQFGMSVIFYFFGRQSLASFGDFTISFLTNEMYVKSTCLANLAVFSYVFGARIGSKTKFRLPRKSISKVEIKLVYYVGLTFLIFTLFYLLSYIYLGKIRIGMPYYEYLNSGIIDKFYPWLLLLYSLGLVFTISVADKSRQKIALLIFCFSGIIFFTTGNRGEVLYPTLAALGISYYKNRKIKLIHIAMVIGLVFILIPLIRITRHNGTMSIFNTLSMNTFDAIAEMGHQLRLSVLILSDFADGTRDYLYGFSYLNPIVNIVDNFVPFNIRLKPPLSFNFESAFSGLGFSQVAESYANFGVVGVLFYHFIISFFIRKSEIKEIEGHELAFWGGVLVILINATRNRFAFVLGQLLILTIIDFIIKVYLKTTNRTKQVTYND